MIQKSPTVKLPQLRNEIVSWMRQRVSDEALEWITQKNKNLENGGEDWELFSSFSAVPRYIGKQSLSLSEKEQSKANEIQPGWHPESWTIDELGRLLLILSVADRSETDFLEALDKLFVSSDMREAVALYKSIAVLPYPNKLNKRAAEGIRSNMTSVFNAMALNNPYPVSYFDQSAWNQLVLKALFVESPLYQIQGIDERANKVLARMLVDYAHERWAAGRSVSPELWRPVGPFAEGEIIDDLNRVLKQPKEIQQHAAILALSVSPSKRAEDLVNGHSDLKQEIEQKSISWDNIGKRASVMTTKKG